jgi:hypothetical protein
MEGGRNAIYDSIKLLNINAKQGHNLKSYKMETLMKEYSSVLALHKDNVRFVKASRVLSPKQVFLVDGGVRSQTT